MALIYRNLGFVCKRAKILIAVLLCSVHLNAQNANQYSFTAVAGTFNSILGQPGVGPVPPVLGNNVISNGIIPFQFPFSYCGNTYSGFRVCSNGWVSLTSTVGSTTPTNDLSELQFIKPALMPLWDDLTGAAPLGAAGLFVTTGTTPNRVFTFEYNKWGWNETAITPVISFQIKIYETTNIIEFIYRPEIGNVINPDGATIGIADGNTVPTFLTLSNSGAAPTTSSTTFVDNIVTRPASGQIYRFTPPPPCSGAPPIAAINPTGPINICTGANVVFSSTLVPPATGVTYQWELSTTGTAPWAPIANATNANATVSPAVTSYYRVVTTCTSSGLKTNSDSVLVTPAPPTYATVPYFQDFENWTNYCDNHDIPQGATTNWRGTPATGDSAWRRDDEGNTANWITTGGAYFPPSMNGAHSARFASASISSSPFPPNNVTGNLDLFLDCSGITGDKRAYFYFINPSFGNPAPDSLKISVSTDGGLTFNQVAVCDSAENWKLASAPIQSNAPQTILRFTGFVGGGDFSDIGLDSLYIAPPCVGQPVAGSIPNPFGICTGNSVTLSPQGTSMAGDLSFVWQESTNGGLNWTTIPGATSQDFVTPPLYDTVSYRMIITCNGSTLSDMTNVITLNVASPVYAQVPYTESFENWINNCDILDVPSNNWINSPAFGDNSWRREDQGSTTWSFIFGDYAPPSKHLNHSARFHSSVNSATGDLDLFIDCSPIAGTKELQFYYINPTSFNDSLRVLVSDNNGVTFTSLASFGADATWSLKQIPIISTSAQTIIKFQGVGDFNFTDDLGIDYVRVLPPCAGTPFAGTVDSTKACANQNLDLSLTGTSSFGGLTYQWQESPDNINWTNVVNGNLPITTTVIIAPTFYRAIVTCSNSNISDTSNSQFFDIAPFYICYCKNSAQSASGEDIGNVTIRRALPIQVVLNNGSAFPLAANPNSINTYTDYTAVPAADIHKGETYNYIITAITDGFGVFSNAGIYIDMNQDGNFDPFAENVGLGAFDPFTQRFSVSFILPLTAKTGITGMRIVQDQNFPVPCMQPFMGEVEDYLVNIEFPVCKGPLNAGVSEISDTLLCAGEPFMVIDTTHEKSLTSIAWIWQSSPDNINWTDITGTDMKDTLLLNAPMTNTYYRLKMTCTPTTDETFSNASLMKIKPAYFCYCSSYADGASSDLSDLGAFSIGTFVVNTGGPHLMNPGATRSYTTNNNTVTLYVDTTYQVAAYHIIKDATQQDAKVTLFIDYDNNFVYDAPAERVWTGFANASNVFVNSTVNIPASAVKNVLTGMRLIINNDVNPGVPSDQGCGTYLSGETEDYVVMLKDKNDPTGVPNISGFKDVFIYPNPTDGLINLRLVSSRIEKQMDVRITNIMGQEVYYQNYKVNTNEFMTNIDLTNKPKGIYFVELIGDNEKIVRKIILR